MKIFKFRTMEIIFAFIHDHDGLPKKNSEINIFPIYFVFLIFSL